MNEALFSLGNLLIMPFWLLMIAAPGWRWTARVMGSPLVALAPALAYAALVLPALGSLLPAVASPRLDAIALLLGTARGATTAWMHFLAFDLLVGRQIYLEARQRQTSAWVSSPILLCTLLLGPLGYLLHLLARSRPSATEVDQKGS